MEDMTVPKELHASALQDGQKLSQNTIMLRGRNSGLIDGDEAGAQNQPL